MRQAWTPEEDDILLKNGTTFRNAWKYIVAHFLPDRSVSAVRNRFQRLEIARKLMEGETVTIKGQEVTGLKNTCKLCGAPKRGHPVCPLASGAARASPSTPAAMGPPIMSTPRTTERATPPGPPRKKQKTAALPSPSSAVLPQPSAVPEEQFGYDPAELDDDDPLRVLPDVSTEELESWFDDNSFVELARMAVEEDRFP